MMPRPAVLALTTLLLLSACSGDSATLISADKIAEFKPGSSNQTEVMATLGKPIHTITEANGTKIDQYAMEAGATGGGSVVPSWMGGSETPESYGMVSFVYSAGGILKEIKTSK